jgi:hypothetical protein
MLCCVSSHFFAALVARGAHSQTPTATDNKSCCKTASSRTALLAAAPGVANAAGVRLGGI